MGPWCHIHRPGPCGPLPPVRSQGGRSPPGWWASTLIVEGLCLALKTVGGKLMDFMPVHLVGQICSSSDYLFFTRRNAPGFSENLGSLVWGASWLQLLQALCDVGSSACLGGAARVAFQALWHMELCGRSRSARSLVPLGAPPSVQCSTVLHVSVAMVHRQLSWPASRLSAHPRALQRPHAGPTPPGGLGSAALLPSA